MSLEDHNNGLFFVVEAMHGNPQQYKPYICTSLALLAQSLDPILSTDFLKDKDILRVHVSAPLVIASTSTNTTNQLLILQLLNEFFSFSGSDGD